MVVGPLLWCKLLDVDIQIYPVMNIGVTLLFRDAELTTLLDATVPSDHERPLTGRRANDQLVEAAVARLSILSRREREVLRGLMAGQQNKVIARSLNLSPRTVEAHRDKMMDRLGANSLAEVIVLAIQAGETSALG